ncbi:MAG TPA: nuclear transport factor 2 family protein, partial [Gemmatimonadales bacterium]|nr:nuclear transport factor 2 family protein [Gemmatimonadales bacterium]
PGGRATVVGSALEISSYLAWASVDYRWVAGDGRSGVTGRATFVLERLGGTWRIKHLHSSSVNQP